MTKIDRPEVEDRITVMDDEKKRALDLFDMRLVPPEGVGIFDEPTRCYRVNLEWAKIIMGMVSWLAEIAPWQDANHEGYAAIEEILKFLRGDNCMDCEGVIDCLELDPNYIALQSMIYSQSEAATQQHLDALEDLYDGTPQSIGASIPVGAPNASEDNALCHTLETFVALYAAVKLGKIQEKNFLQIAWDRIRTAGRDFYYEFVDQFGFVLNSDPYSCFVSDAEAMTALVDDAAIQAVACCILDSLKIVALSETVFNNAITSCAASLTGAAQKIACILENDNNLQVYLSFLESYNLALVSGDIFDCPCEDDYPNLVIGWCVNASSFGTLTRESIDTWLLDSELNPADGSHLINFRDSIDRTFKIMTIERLSGVQFEFGKATFPPCTLSADVFGWNNLIGQNAVNGYLFATQPAYGAIQMRITVSQVGT